MLSPLSSTPAGVPADFAIVIYKGIPVLTNSNQSIALLDPTTAIAGTFLVIQEAIDRWQREAVQADPFHSTLRAVSRNYDNWFLARNPLELAWPQKVESVHAKELIQAVETVQAGIRFGASIEFRLEVVTKSAEDAAAAAAIGRWLPGFMELNGRDDHAVAMLGLAEDLTIMATGNVASLSFSLSERRLRELADAEARKQAAGKRGAVSF